MGNQKQVGAGSHTYKKRSRPDAARALPHEMLDIVKDFHASRRQ